MSLGVQDRPKAHARNDFEAEGEVITLNVPPTVRLRISPDDFWELCGVNRDLRLERTAEGVLIVNMPAGSGTGRRNALLTARLVQWAQVDGTGVAFDSSAGFTFPSGLACAPDASWIIRERWDALTIDQQEKFAPICPDFVAELTSPSDTRLKVREKMEQYLTEGVRLGWLIDPKSGEVDIYRRDRQVETLPRPASLSGRDVLPRFVLDLKGILFD